MPIGLQVGRIEDDDDSIGFWHRRHFAAEDLDRDGLVGRSSAERIGAWKVDQFDRFEGRAGQGHASGFVLDGHPRVVSDSGLATAKSIKEATFACVGVSDQGDGRGAIGRSAVGHTIDPLLGPFDANATGFDSSEAQSVPDDREFDGIAHGGLSDHFDNFAGYQSHFKESGGDRVVSFDVENGPVLAFLQIIQSDRDHGRGLMGFACRGSRFWE